MGTERRRGTGVRRGGGARAGLRLGVALGAAAGVTLSACAAPGVSSGSDDDGALIVWVDETRTAGAEAFKESHPDLDVKITTIPNDPGHVLTKISLANRAGSGWPDVVFLNTPEDVASLADASFDYAEPLNDLVAPDVLDGFVDGALDGCTFDGKVYCLRNDIGQTVLWYNEALMTEFGYDVPETWAQFKGLGERVANEHPGYLVGNLNGKWGAGTYFTSSGCPTRDVVDLRTVRINTDDPRCTRVADMLEPLLDNGTMSVLSAADPAFAKLGEQRKILMLPGPSWYGDFRFKKSFKSPKGEIAAAPMPRWEGEDQPRSGSVGGGAFVVSSHAEDKQAAVEFATWMTTDVDHQSEQPTYPAFEAAAQAWGEAKADDDFYAEDPFPVMRRQAPLIADTFGWVRYANDWNNSFNETVAASDRQVPLRQALQQWGAQLAEAAKATDYEVVK